MYYCQIWVAHSSCVILITFLRISSERRVNSKLANQKVISYYYYSNLSLWVALTILSFFFFVMLSSDIIKFVLYVLLVLLQINRKLYSQNGKQEKLLTSEMKSYILHICNNNKKRLLRDILLGNSNMHVYHNFSNILCYTDCRIIILSFSTVSFRDFRACCN